MNRKNHQIRIELEIHAVTCPGVWLCQNGDVELTITSLGYNFRAGPLPPRFPLCFHEQFVMEGYFNNIRNQSNVEKVLASETINFSLWQNGRRLAHYPGKLAILLEPHHNCTTNAINYYRIDSDLIMSRASCFPGSIAPKIEFSSKLEIMDKCDDCNSNVYSIIRKPSSDYGKLRSRPLTIVGLRRSHSEDNIEKLCNSEFKRQKAVCHARNQMRWQHCSVKSRPNYAQKTHHPQGICEKQLMQNVSKSMRTINNLDSYKSSTTRTQYDRIDDDDDDDDSVQDTQENRGGGRDFMMMAAQKESIFCKHCLEKISHVTCCKTCSSTDKKEMGCDEHALRHTINGKSKTTSFYDQNNNNNLANFGANSNNIHSSNCEICLRYRKFFHIK